MSELFYRCVIWGIPEGICCSGAGAGCVDVSLESQDPLVQGGKEMQLCLDGGGEGRLLSHHVGKGIRRNVGLPSAELAQDGAPQPWGLASPSQACC